MSEPNGVETPQDREQLDLLATFHYVAAGITALLSLLPLAQLAVGLSVLGRVTPAPRGEELFAAVAAWFFVLVGAVAAACGLALAACLALAGRSLAARQRHTFCVAVAAVACLLVPFGTLLGIFSLLVLTRPSVRARFAASESQPPVATA